MSCGTDLELYTVDSVHSWRKIIRGRTRPGTARNKRPRVLGDHPIHFLGTLGRPERLGTVWNGILSLRDALVVCEQAGRPKSAPVADQADSKKIESENFEIF